MASLSVGDLGGGRFKLRWRELVADASGGPTRGADGRLYWKDFTSGGARVRFGRCSYRVLTVSNDPARLAALRRAARQAPTRGRRASRLFWFAPLEAFDPATPASPLSPLHLPLRASRRGVPGFW